MAALTPWDWTEVIEGTAVSVLFIVAPIMFRFHKHHQASERRHDEVMAAHRASADHLKEIRKQL